MNDNENTPFPNLWVALFGGNYTSLFDYIEKRVKVNSYCFHLKNLGKDVQAPNQQKEENNNVRGDINEVQRDEMIFSCSLGRTEIIPKTWPGLLLQVIYRRHAERQKNQETNLEVHGEVRNM